jgi:hypothetical protein
MLRILGSMINRPFQRWMYIPRHCRAGNVENNLLTNVSFINNIQRLHPVLDHHINISHLLPSTESQDCTLGQCSLPFTSSGNSFKGRLRSSGALCYDRPSICTVPDCVVDIAHHLRGWLGIDRRSRKPGFGIEFPLRECLHENFETFFT